jgi:hypothetical protein
MKVLPFKDRLLALPENISPGLLVTNVPAYFPIVSDEENKLERFVTCN